MTKAKDPFLKTTSIEEPGIVGAEWWRESVKSARDAGPRRDALRSLLLLGGVTGPAVAGLLGCDDEEEDVQVGWKEEQRPSLDMQKQHGWSFGAPTENLAYKGASTVKSDGSPLLPAQLATLSDQLKPNRSAFATFYGPTLFKSVVAKPSLKIPGDSPEQPLAGALKPVFTGSMKQAFHQGEGLARAFKKNTSKLFLIIDLPGPEAVAFAAGAASLFEPIFFFNNWPHPRGVVPSHMTLGAAVYYQPELSKQRSSRPSTAPGALVLDRNRLTPYKDNKSQFDNRYLAALPTSANLKSWSVDRVLYVVPTDSDIDVDDVNETFVDYELQKVDVRIIPATSFKPASGKLPPGAEAGSYYYEGDTSDHDDFWSDYGDAGGAGGSDADGKSKSSGKGIAAAKGAAYAPSARLSPPGSGLGRTSVAVMAGAAMGLTAGAVLGARHGAMSRSGGPLSASGKGGTFASSRSGSFGRTSSFGGG